MNKDTIDDISEIIQEKLDAIYNTAVAMANVSMLNYYKDDVEVWKKKQIRDMPRLKQDIKTMIRKELPPLYKAIERAVLLSYKVADGTFKDIDTNQKKIEVRANKLADKRIKQMQASVTQTLEKLPNSVEKAQLKNINEVVNKLPKSAKLGRIQTLYDGIVKQTEHGVANSIQVVYRDHKVFGFREYMEMNVRTTFQHNAGDFQIQAGKDAGIIFYLCSYHSDCANDHANWQGKMYYDEDWENLVSEELHDKVLHYISENKLMTIQNVRDDSPWLTTRPNCRHYFLPMNTEEVLGSSVKQMLEDNNMKKGTYDKQNYVDLKRQRYNERQIRAYKSDLETKQLQLRKSAPEQKGSIEKEIIKDRALIKTYQAKNRDLVKSNKALEREPERENPKILVNDLGYRYDVKYYK